MLVIQNVKGASYFTKYFNTIFAEIAKKWNTL